MSLFSRNQKRRAGPIVPAGELASLSAVGRATYIDGQYVDASVFYLPGFLAAGPPTAGTPEYEAFVDGFLDELFAAASATDEWAYPGALYVAKDFLGPDGMANPRFVAIVDRALPFMVSAGVSDGFIPMFLQSRWLEFGGSS
jgi:hypothetical protein